MDGGYIILQTITVPQVSTISFATATSCLVMSQILLDKAKEAMFVCLVKDVVG